MSQTNHSHSFLRRVGFEREHGTNAGKTLTPLVLHLEFKAQALLTCTLKGIGSVTPTPFNFTISSVSVLGFLF